MEKRTQEMLLAIMAQAGLEPKEGDMERFGQLLDTYMGALKMLHSVDLGEEEIAPTFHPEWRAK